MSMMGGELGGSTEVLLALISIAKMGVLMKAKVDERWERLVSRTTRQMPGFAQGTALSLLASYNSRQSIAKRVFLIFSREISTFAYMY